MQGFKLRTLTVSCLLLALSSTVFATNRADVTLSAAEIMNQTCQVFPDGYIGNPSDCTAWGYCENNQLVKQGYCGSGQNYDISTGQCIWTTSTSCITTVAAACEAQNDPIYIANPSSCSAYAYCDGQGGYTNFTCPTGQYFDSSTKTCTYKNTCAGGNICALVPNGAFLADANECGNYIQCIDGSPLTSAACTGGKFFNSITGKCQTQYPCDYYNADPSACSVYEPGTNFVADGKTCYGYYTCTSTEGPGTWSRCPFGTHFDATSQQCVSPVSTSCAYNRCGNLNLQFVTSLTPAGCTDYLVCTNQQASATPDSCATINADFIYFDEIKQKCVDVVPTYSICS